MGAEQAVKCDSKVSDAPYVMFSNRYNYYKDGRGIEILQTCFDLVGARGACATSIWVDMQCWQHLEDGGNGILGGEMGLKRSLTRRMWLYDIGMLRLHDWLK